MASSQLLPKSERRHLPSGVAGIAAGLPPLPDRNVEGRGARDAERTRAGVGEGCGVPAHVDIRGLRRPERAPSVGGLLGEREPHGASLRVRRGQAVRRGAHMAYHRARVDRGRIARIFTNTYGPGMRRDDEARSRRSSSKALRRRAITVHGMDCETRSLCHVMTSWRDWVAGPVKALGPMNLGNPEESEYVELARFVIATDKRLGRGVAFTDRPVDDPTVRCPDITLARRTLGWTPTVPLGEGLARTAVWAKEMWMG